MRICGAWLDEATSECFLFVNYDDTQLWLQLQLDGEGAWTLFICRHNEHKGRRGRAYDNLDLFLEKGYYFPEPCVDQAKEAAVLAAHTWLDQNWENVRHDIEITSTTTNQGPDDSNKESIDAALPSYDYQP